MQRSRAKASNGGWLNAVVAHLRSAFDCNWSLIVWLIRERSEGWDGALAASSLTQKGESEMRRTEAEAEKSLPTLHVSEIQPFRSCLLHLSAQVCYFFDSDFQSPLTLWIALTWTKVSVSRPCFSICLCSWELPLSSLQDGHLNSHRNSIKTPPNQVIFWKTLKSVGLTWMEIHIVGQWSKNVAERITLTWRCMWADGAVWLC